MGSYQKDFLYSFCTGCAMDISILSKLIHLPFISYFFFIFLYIYWTNYLKWYTNCAFERYFHQESDKYWVKYHWIWISPQSIPGLATKNSGGKIISFQFLQHRTQFGNNNWFAFVWIHNILLKLPFLAKRTRVFIVYLFKS